MKLQVCQGMIPKIFTPPAGRFDVLCILFCKPHCMESYCCSNITEAWSMLCVFLCHYEYQSLWEVVGLWVNTITQAVRSVLWAWEILLSVQCCQWLGKEWLSLSAQWVRVKGYLCHLELHQYLDFSSCLHSHSWEFDRENSINPLRV